MVGAFTKCQIPVFGCQDGIGKLKPLIQNKGFCEWVGKLHPLERLPILEIFAKDNGNLVEPRRGPDLGIVIRKLVITHPARGFQNDLRRQVKDREHLPQEDLKMTYRWK